VYLLDGGDTYALLGGGFTYIIPDVEKQLRQFDVPTRKIERILILHSHFDHCGIVPYYKNRWPWATITATARSKELLSSPKVLNSIKDLNRMMLKERRLLDDQKLFSMNGFQIDVETVVEEGDIITLGDRTMHIIDAPGHSSCSMAVYVPEEKAMFASDSAGIAFGDQVFTAANSNFDHYTQSLQKIFAYDMDVILAEHQGARSGRDCKKFIRSSLDSSVCMRSMLEESYARTHDVEQSTREVTAQIMSQAPKDWLTISMISIVVRQMMNYIKRIHSNV
jgi:glyoxylase-like metal-dependent hydrolase (beta-lactamase superfamily II)